MAELRVHGTSVMVNAPVREVYQLFTHFDQFPKFMKFVKEVTYLDKQHQRTHWVAHIFGHDEWDAVNDGWIEDRKVGWRSIRGLKNHGRIEFLDAGPARTRITVEIMYDPPAGLIGEIVDEIVIRERFDEALLESMNAFAHLVDKAPPGGLDPNSPNYVFGKDVDATGSARSSNEDYAHPMTSRHPDKMNQPPEKSDPSEGGDVTPKTGASSSEPATDKEQR